MVKVAIKTIIEPTIVEKTIMKGEIIIGHSIDVTEAKDASHLNEIIKKDINRAINKELVRLALEYLMDLSNTKVRYVKLNKPKYIVSELAPKDQPIVIIHPIIEAELLKNWESNFGNIFYGE